MTIRQAYQANTYQEAANVLREVGILPLSSLIPEHPSLESITTKGQWHTGELTDPWLWRDRFPAEGLGAYGRFFAKKPMLISAEMFPLVKNLLEDPYTVQERYDDGLLAKSAVDVYTVIAAQEGIDTRELRAKSGLKAKEAKAEFDRALIDLQSTTDIVIAGISDRLQDSGVKSGWNSSCYMTAAHWMDLHHLQADASPTPEAKKKMRAYVQERCSEAAAGYLTKIFKL
ncbi:AlkZ-related protein [Paenibacillus aestuarii]|uniref:Uncharacterized protein n=1 Tax=Paenibacillus aestuarii TaxID=516965 RepID=A0ABW0K289_9BACL|nr:hypothetical protein [Paenibacillus aestuarii]